MTGGPTPARWTVGVMGSGTEEHVTLAQGIGGLIADLGANLLTGGGRGVMTSVSRAFTGRQGRRGICIGIIPCASESDRATPMPGYPNPYVELAIYTHLPLSGPRGTDDLSRNHINVLSSSVIVALPGGEGTATEVSLAVRYRRPVIAYSTDARVTTALPESVARTDRLEDVEMFLSRCVELRS